jgi:hypothetical protein
MKWHDLILVQDLKCFLFFALPSYTYLRRDILFMQSLFGSDSSFVLVATSLDFTTFKGLTRPGCGLASQVSNEIMHTSLEFENKVENA